VWLSRAVEKHGNCTFIHGDVLLHRATKADLQNHAEGFDEVSDSMSVSVFPSLPLRSFLK